MFASLLEVLAVLSSSIYDLVRGAIGAPYSPDLPVALGDLLARFAAPDKRDQARVRGATTCARLGLGLDDDGIVTAHRTLVDALIVQRQATAQGAALATAIKERRDVPSEAELAAIAASSHERTIAGVARIVRQATVALDLARAECERDQAHRVIAALSGALATLGAADIAATAESRRTRKPKDRAHAKLAASVQTALTETQAQAASLAAQADAIAASAPSDEALAS